MQEREAIATVKRPALNPKAEGIRGTLYRSWRVSGGEYPTSGLTRVMSRSRSIRIAKRYSACPLHAP